MSKVTLADILETLPSLTPDEQLQVRQKTQVTLPVAPMTETEFDQLLLAKGVLSSLPTGLSSEVFESYKPIVINGKPLSETIIEERR
jgi:hypothetical protein